MESKNVVIIGAGLAGLSLALALHQRSVPCMIYESHPKDIRLGGAIMLSPNALRFLDSIGAYDRVKTKGFRFEILNMETDDRVSLGTYSFGSQEMYGYKALRIYRQELVNELMAVLKESRVPIEFKMEYQRVVSESASGVVVEFADGSTIETSMLIGADGIHSRVREYIDPTVQPPKYLGQTAMAGAVKLSEVRLPSPGYRLPASIFG